MSDNSVVSTTPLTNSENLFLYMLQNKSYMIELNNRRGEDGGGGVTSEPNKCYFGLKYKKETPPKFVVNKKVGSFRTQKIEKYDNNDALTLKQEFEYKLDDGKSSGIMFDPPLEYQSLRYDFVRRSPGAYKKNLYHVYSTNSNNPINSNSGKPIGYSKVTEKITDILNPLNSIKKEINYSIVLKESDTLTTPYLNGTYVPNYIENYKNGLLLKEIGYNDTGKIYENNNFYEYDNYFNQLSADKSLPIEEAISHGVAAVQTSIYDCSTGPDFLPLEATFNYLIYNIYSTWVKKTKETSTEYFNNGNDSITINKNYIYSPTHSHIRPIQINTSSPSENSDSYFQYAHEKGKTALLAANMVGIPLVTETKKNGKTISKTETVFPDVLPDTQTGDLLLPKSVSSLDILSGNMSTEVTYNQYDDKGNIQQYTTKSGTPVAIIWGYKQTQPIAKVEGATYAQVSSLATAIINASNDDADDGAVGNPKEQDFLNALDAFRTNSTLSGYQITTYTYDPLIGVRSITPPNGVRKVYIYDTANRLKEVRENNQTGNLLKEYQYNYKH